MTVARVGSGPVRVCDCPKVRHVHGTTAMYSGCRCRCRACRDAAADYYKARYRAKAYGRWQAPFVDAVGTQRRVHALMTLGWDIHTIARKAGVNPGSESIVGKLARDGGRCTAETARRVAAVYDELWDKPRVGRNKGERISVAMTLGRARRGGYAGPLEWDDDEIDDPAASPRDGGRLPCGVPSLDPDAVEAIGRMTRAHYSAAEIATRLGVTDRTVQRYRARIRDEQRQAAA